MTFWQSTCLSICDAAFGWTLAFPRDVGVIVIGILVGLLLCVVRRLTADQDHLRKIGEDERRLRDLIRNARAEGDRDRLSRYQHIRTLVRGRRARAEFPAVCASVLILSLLIPWGQGRLEYLPVQVGQSFQFTVLTPPSMAGEVLHVIPQSGITSSAGWIRVISSDVNREMPVGKAAWSLHLATMEKPVAVAVRVNDHTLEHLVLTDGSYYGEPVQHHSDFVTTEVALRVYRPLGWMPRQLLPGLPGWAVFLTAVTAMTYFGLRKVLQLP